MKNLKKDNFYYGFAGEHYIVSQLYKLRYEANKMEVDYGFDILVNNHYRYSKMVDNHLLTLALQVKTMTVRKGDYDEKEEQGLGKVIYAKKDFILTSSEFNLITGKDNGFLVCMFNQIDKSNPLGYFWLSGKMLIEALNLGYIKHFESDKPGGSYKLTAQISVVSSINFLMDHCINLIERSTFRNKFIDDLKLLLSDSTVIPNNSLSKIELINLLDENQNPCIGTLNKDLTILENLPNNMNIQLFSESIISEQFCHLINTIQNQKFTYEESAGLYDHL